MNVKRGSRDTYVRLLSARSEAVYVWHHSEREIGGKSSRGCGGRRRRFDPEDRGSEHLDLAALGGNAAT